MTETGNASRRRRRPAAVPTKEDRDVEKRALLGEIALLTGHQDALKTEIALRKEKLLLLMAQDGDRSVELSGIASASFTRRRSFKVKDAAMLVKLFPPAVLAENVKVTAAFYDAAMREGYRIGDAVTQGEDENLSVTPSRSKESKQFRDMHITEARKKAEHAVSEYRKHLKQF